MAYIHWIFNMSLIRKVVSLLVPNLVKNRNYFRNDSIQTFPWVSYKLWYKFSLSSSLPFHLLLEDKNSDYIFYWYFIGIHVNHQSMTARKQCGNKIIKEMHEVWLKTNLSVSRGGMVTNWGYCWKNNGLPKHKFILSKLSSILFWVSFSSMFLSIIFTIVVLVV